MMIRTALTDTARATLVAFCVDNLKPGLDAVRYADNGLPDDLEGAMTFEIAARDCRRGYPMTITFADDADFRMEECA